MAFQPIGGRDKGLIGTQALEPRRLMIDGGAAAQGNQDEDQRRDQQACLALEGPKGPQRHARACRRAARFRNIANERLIVFDGIAGEPETFEPALDPGANGTRIRIDMRARLLEQDHLGKTRPAQLDLRKSSAVRCRDGGVRYRAVRRLRVRRDADRGPHARPRARVRENRAPARHKRRQPRRRPAFRKGLRRRSSPSRRG